MSGLAALLVGRREPGMYRWDSHLPAVDVEHAVAHAGWRAFVLDARAVTLRGLMIVPPIPEDPEEARPWFRRLRELRDQLVAGGVPFDRLRDLSMGMSQDFEVAIEEGATMVRVGTSIFGHRPPPRPQP